MNQFNSTEITLPDGEKKEVAPKAAPTLDGVVVEDADTPDRFWRWCLRTSRPLATPKDPASPNVASPPWGTMDINASMGSRVPINLVGAGHIYMNAARYTFDKFKGFLSLMELRDIPKGEYVYFTKTSEDPLTDGYITQWRFVSKEAYQNHFRVNVAMDKNPDKKKSRKTLFDQINKCVVGEMKLYGRGKRVPKPKVENPDDEEEEEEEEEDEDDGEDFGEEYDPVAAQEHLNKVMKCDGRGRNKGEWALGFGFITESVHHKVFRLWSRAIFHPGPPVVETKEED